MSSKRVFDLIFSFFAVLILILPVFLFLLAVYFSDRANPIYYAPRVGLRGKMFTMYKVRTMIPNADRNQVDSTSSEDARITKVGKYIRLLKLDELCQFFNVLLGNMSVVGPRPNVKRETDLYSSEELKLLDVKPGITDFSSIIFSDLGSILSGASDPNIAYNQLVRPWKSRFGLFYIANMSFKLDLYLIAITLLSIFNREQALNLLVNKLEKLKAPPELISIAKRDQPLIPTSPPGFTEVVTNRLK